MRVHQGDDASGPVAVTLAPLAALTGRAVDPDAAPVAGALVRPGVFPPADFGLRLPEVTSDENGRFRVPDVPAGCDYTLALQTPAAIARRRYTFLEKVTVRPGETTKVGDVRFERD